MINKKWLIPMVIIFVVIFLSASICSAQDDEFARRTLKGLTGVKIVIGDLFPVLKEGGLTEDQIRTDVELKLRMAGIRVLSNEEWPSGLLPYLYVRVYGSKSEIGFVAINIYIGLKQDIILTRNPLISSEAFTWSTEYTGHVGVKKITIIRESIKDLVDEFLNAYLSVNPKK